MDPKKHNKQTVNNTNNKTAQIPDTDKKDRANIDEDISSGPILAEKDEVKIAEEKLRNKTNTK